MPREFRKREEENELVRRFEDHLKKKNTEFFDLDAYEQIIDYYLLRAKYNKALQAVNQAIGQYPFSTELLTVKADILVNLEEYEQALDLLEKAKAFQPNDWEIFLTTGSILSQQGKFKEAIENYEQALTLAESANLLMMPGRTRPGQWNRDARQMLDAAWAAFKAAKAKDLAGVEAVSDQLYESCVACHKAYRPDYGKPKPPQ